MDTIARRAKLLLEENAGVKQPVAETAAALQVSDRHLRRAFQAACHVSPIEYLQTYRLLLAKNLLTETSLSMTDIAFASGFGSITRFNTLFKDHYRITPGEFRKNSARRKNRQITVKIGYRPPYAYDAIFRFLQERRIPGAEKAEGGIYSRTIRVQKDGRPVCGIMTVSNDEKHSALDLTVSEDLLCALSQVIGKVKKLFDLYCDPYAVYDTLEGFEKVLPGAFRMSLRIPGSVDDFEICVRAIVGQPISVRAACTLLKHLADAFGQSTRSDAGLPHLFLTAEDILSIPEDIAAALGPLGIPRRKANAIQAAAALIAGEKTDFGSCSAPKEAMAKLLRIKGIGPWTARYIAMRAMNDTDVLLDSDHEMARLLSLHRLTAADMEPFRPWQSYLTAGLWELGREENEKAFRS